jgi:hypothetical protein
MSHSITMSQAPCVECKSNSVKSDLETVKLRQNYDDGTHQECKAPVFNGDGNVECLFYVEERFRHYADKLGWTAGPEMFDNFEEILQDTALEKWETRTQNIAQADQTMARFTQAFQECLLEHLDPFAKDHMIKCLKDFCHPTCMLNLEIMPLELKLLFDIRIVFQVRNLILLHNKRRTDLSVLINAL